MKRYLESTVLLLAACALAGCIPAGDAAEVSNTCWHTSDCEAGGGVCADVDGVSTCVTTKADLPGLILEVRPSAEASFGLAPASYLVPFGGAGLVTEAPEGLLVQHDIELPQINIWDLELAVGYDYKNCMIGPDYKLPAEFTFYRHSTHAGLPGHIAKATLQPDALESYMVTLPAGKYDIHIVPHTQQEGCAPPPPTFYREVNLGKGGAMPLALDAPPIPLSGTIVFPKNLDLQGWSLDVVDPKRGLVVSSTAALEVDPLSLFAKYQIEYYWDWGKDASPLLRLRPPEGQPGLRFFWALTALSPFDLNKADITLVDLNADLRQVEAFVLDDNGLPVVGTVSFKSLQLSDNASQNATYDIHVDTDENGGFTTKLPPGDYQVTAYPTADPTKAITTADEPWKISAMDAGCFCGKTIIVRNKSTIDSSVMLPDGEPLGFGTASVYPSPQPQQSYLLSRLVADAPSSQVDSTAIGPEGQFTLHADPGEVDLRVLPPEGSLYPWLVRSRVKVNADQDGTQGTTLATLSLSYPAMLQGVVRDPSSGATVPNATVRAWLPVTTTAENPSSTVIQIAEGTTGFDGRYTLLVAPSISK